MHGKLELLLEQEDGQFGRHRHHGATSLWVLQLELEPQEQELHNGLEPPELELPELEPLIGLELLVLLELELLVQEPQGLLELLD